LPRRAPPMRPVPGSLRGERGGAKEEKTNMNMKLMFCELSSRVFLPQRASPCRGLIPGSLRGKREGEEKKKNNLNVKSILCELSIWVFLRAKAKYLIVCKGKMEGGGRGKKRL